MCSTLKIALLTTETLHHTWFAQQLANRSGALLCIKENKNINPSFETKHAFEDRRDVFEKDFFFSGRMKMLNQVCDTLTVEDINQQEVCDIMLNFNPNILIVFGTTYIKSELINLFRKKIVNLHGGDPELYRGLDSHLWGIYHNDWANLYTTIHVLDSKLDNGEIIKKKKLPLSKIKNIYEMRAYNTEVCIELTSFVLRQIEEFGKFFSLKQNVEGRYYSSMPTCLKEICCRKFKNRMSK